MARKSGSATARGGFDNEKAIAEAFRSNGTFSNQCLEFMGYKDGRVKDAITVPPRLGVQSARELLGLTADPTAAELEQITRQQKADVRLTIEHSGQIVTVNLSLKKANKSADFNQIDKRSVDTYQRLWGFTDDVALWLKLFTGAADRVTFDRYTKSLDRDNKRHRLKFTGFPETKQQLIVDFLNAKKTLLIDDVVRGRGSLSADYIVVTRQAGISKEVHLCKASDAVNYLQQGDIKKSPRGSIEFGKLTIQRYGGSPSPELLQFKIKPSLLFDVDGTTFPWS
jgi:hypothetical protein